MPGTEAVIPILTLSSRCTLSRHSVVVLSLKGKVSCFFIYLIIFILFVSFILFILFILFIFSNRFYRAESEQDILEDEYLLKQR